VLPVQVARGFPEGAHHLAARAAPDCQRTRVFPQLKQRSRAGRRGCKTARSL
jgi:hypothetical protein